MVEPLPSRKNGMGRQGNLCQVTPLNPMHFFVPYGSLMFYIESDGTHLSLSQRLAFIFSFLESKIKSLSYHPL